MNYGLTELKLQGQKNELKRQKLNPQSNSVYWERVEPSQLTLRDNFDIDSITAVFSRQQFQSRFSSHLLSLDFHAVKHGGRFYPGDRFWSQLSVTPYLFIQISEVDAFIEALSQFRRSEFLQKNQSNPERVMPWNVSMRVLMPDFLKMLDAADISKVALKEVGMKSLNNLFWLERPAVENDYL
eukprot:snap_masked-scaffold_4-processed-gene-1.23-mRNA-1 protein AED:1.00 eAED:1.00 QI:0/-1/0/0/-1/1/1/0/182